jgi:hypothetical protein
MNLAGAVRGDSVQTINNVKDLCAVVHSIADLLESLLAPVRGGSLLSSIDVRAT